MVANEVESPIYTFTASRKKFWIGQAFFNIFLIALLPLISLIRYHHIDALTIKVTICWMPIGFLLNFFSYNGNLTTLIYYPDHFEFINWRHRHTKIFLKDIREIKSTITPTVPCLIFYFKTGRKGRKLVMEHGYRNTVLEPVFIDLYHKGIDVFLA